MTTKSVARTAPLLALALLLTTAGARPALALDQPDLRVDSRTNAPRFRVMAFYTGRSDQAHISFVREANVWFPRMAAAHGFTYEATTNWANLNAENLARSQIVVFLDTRPEAAEQRAALKEYIESGGAWMGFHFAGFALTPSQFPQNWDWYHQDFLGAGSYVGNTWRPTAAILKVEDPAHPVTRNLPTTFKSSPNEWYKWSSDLRTNKQIQILVSIDPASFPLGTGPKPHEIWHSGYYPVVWTHRTYRMVYFNMGHNDIDYAGRTNQELSFTFGNKAQDQLVLNALEWLGAADGGNAAASRPAKP
ncbi:MAG: ThuA domain-containing protein [Verrucomicrobiota bacterium]